MRTSSRSALSGSLGGLLFLLSVHLSGATYTVTTTADSGPGSLRQAILDANANPGTDAIAFAIPGTGVRTIVPLTALPVITEAVTIDGYTQPGASPNTLAVGDDAVILVEISGVNGGGGLTVQPAGVGTGWTTIRGLVIDDAAGVFFDYSPGGNQSGQNVLAGCFLGVSPDGASARPPSGVDLRSWSNTVGGLAAADRNVIAGAIFGSEASKGNSVTNNYIGTDASGTVALGVDGGVSFGDSTPFFSEQNSVSGNLISGNTGTAVYISGGTGNSVSNNLIGTDATGTLPLGNGGDGVHVWTGGGIFGLNKVVANTIAFNAGTGVSEGGTIGAAITGNSIHDNGGLGIASSYLATPPTLSTATTGGSTTTIHGSTSGMGGTAALEFFSSPTCDPSGFGEGAVPIGTTSVPAGTDFTVTVPAVAPGAVITGTSMSFETSGFSACVLVTDGGPTPTIQSIAPTSGPAYGGTTSTLTGLGYLPSALATFGGVVANGSVVSETEMTTSTPVARSGNTQRRRRDESEFLGRDAAEGLGLRLPRRGAGRSVPRRSRERLPRRAHGRLRRRSLLLATRPCGATRWRCSSSKPSTARATSPPGCTGVFADVPCPGPFTDWVEAAPRRGDHRRLRRRHLLSRELRPARPDGGASPEEPSTAPPTRRRPAPAPLPTFRVPRPSPTGSSSSPPKASPAAAGRSNYCPASPSTRGQMAVFLVKTFGLP